MTKAQIKALVTEAQQIERSQTKHPWPISAVGRFSHIQGLLNNAVPSMADEDAKGRAETLVNHIYVHFIGRTNELPAYVLTNVFDAIINGEVQP